MDFEQRVAVNSQLFLTQIREPDAGLSWLLGIVAIIVLFCLLYGSTQFVVGFFGELRYLSAEIRRTEGEERRYYIEQRRRLLLLLLPFVKR